MRGVDVGCPAAEAVGVPQCQRDVVFLPGIDKLIAVAVTADQPVQRGPRADLSQQRRIVIDLEPIARGHGTVFPGDSQERRVGRPAATLVGLEQHLVIGRGHKAATAVDQRSIKIEVTVDVTNELEILAGRSGVGEPQGLCQQRTGLDVEGVQHRGHRLCHRERKRADVEGAVGLGGQPANRTEVAGGGRENRPHTTGVGSVVAEKDGRFESRRGRRRRGPDRVVHSPIISTANKTGCPKRTGPINADRQRRVTGTVGHVVAGAAVGSAATVNRIGKTGRGRWGWGRNRGRRHLLDFHLERAAEKIVTRAALQNVSATTTNDRVVFALALHQVAAVAENRRIVQVSVELVTTTTTKQRVVSQPTDDRILT